MNTFTDWFEQQKQRAEAAKREKIELRAAPPTYPALDNVPVETARLKVDQAFDEFLDAATAWNEKYAAGKDEEDNSFQDYAAEHVEAPPPPVHAARISTGVGKTQRVAARLARYIKARREAGDMRSWLYLVPTHRLGEDIADYFRKPGLSAKVYRGLGASDPSIPGNMERPKGEQEQMCLAPEKRALAEALHKSVSQSCCKYKDQRCEFHPEGRGLRNCGYQEQIRGEQPDVWIASHLMAFHPQKAFGEIAGVIIDEGFVIKSGVYGIGKRKKGRDEEEIPGMPLDDIASDECTWRKELIEILREHPLGGLHRDRFRKIQSSFCKLCIGLEWEIANSLKLTPEMSPAQIEAVKESETMLVCRRARWMVGTWGALRELLGSDIKVSGRLVLAKSKAGKIVLQRRGIRPVVKSRRLPTFAMDATLPEVSILRVFFPQIREDDITHIDVDMPKHVHVTQIIGAPVSKLKLWGREKKQAKGENREDVKRSILQWWYEDDRRLMLVVCQEKFENWLRANLPKEIVVARGFKGELLRENNVIAIEHYNNVTGLDRYKNVSSILQVGRIQPAPENIEAYAGALVGSEPIKMPAAKPGQPRPWYKPVPRAIRMADGTGIVVEDCDWHPDPMCECVRKLLCEGEMIQAFGRARAINRDTPEKALKVGLYIHNVVLDLTVDKVIPWTAPNEVVEPLVLDGLELTAPGDMAKGWPHVWKTAEAARWARRKLRAAAAGTSGVCSSIYYTLEKTPPVPLLAILYQRRGPKQKFREALFDPRVLSHPGAKLIEKLGETYAALAQLVRKHEIEPLAGAGKVVVDAILRRARYALSDKQQPTYTGTGSAGRYTLAKDYRNLPTYDGSPGGITTPHVDAYSKLPLELRMRALGLHENAERPAID